MGSRDPSIHAGVLKISDRDLFHILALQDLGDVFHDGAAELKFSGDVGILVGFVDARPHGKAHDIAVEKHAGATDSGIGAQMRLWDRVTQGIAVGSRGK